MASALEQFVNSVRQLSAQGDRGRAGELGSAGAWAQGGQGWGWAWALATGKGTGTVRSGAAKTRAEPCGERGAANGCPGPRPAPGAQVQRGGGGGASEDGAAVGPGLGVNVRGMGDPPGSRTPFCHGARAAGRSCSCPGACGAMVRTLQTGFQMARDLSCLLPCLCLTWGSVAGICRSLATPFSL